MLEDSSFIMRLIGTLIDLYSLVILVAVIMSWLPVNRRSLLWTTVRGLTEPALAPIRRVLPPMGGLDLSPMVLLIGLQILRRFFW
jgi:YggT family protein